MRQEINISGNDITTLDDFFSEVEKLFSFPSYYGRNLDDLLDALTTYMDPNTTIHWINSEQSQKYLGQDFNRIVEVLDRVKSLNSSFEYYLN